MMAGKEYPKLYFPSSCGTLVLIELQRKHCPLCGVVVDSIGAKPVPGLDFLSLVWLTS